MTTILNIMVIIFIIIGTIAIIFAYRPLFVKVDNQKNITLSEDNTINKSLELLKGKNSEEVKAGAFIVLIQLAYVLVHTMVNQGNNYDDKKQTKDFCNSLTSQFIDNLNTMEGKYE